MIFMTSETSLRDHSKIENNDVAFIKSHRVTCFQHLQSISTTDSLAQNSAQLNNPLKKPSFYPGKAKAKVIIKAVLERQYFKLNKLLLKRIWNLLTPENSIRFKKRVLPPKKSMFPKFHCRCSKHLFFNKGEFSTE